MSEQKSSVPVPQNIEMLMESLPLAIIFTNDARRIISANRAALELLGYSREGLLGRPLEVLLPERFLTQGSALYEDFSSNPATLPMGRGRALAARKSDGTEFPAEFVLSTLPSDSPFYLISILDISPRKEAENQLRERQTRLETDLHQTRQQLDQQLAAATRLEERQHLGRELDDTLSQRLYSIGLGLQTAKAKLQEGADPTQALDYCLELTESALLEMRTLLFRLRGKSP